MIPHALDPCENIATGKLFQGWGSKDKNFKGKYEVKLSLPGFRLKNPLRCRNME